MSAHANPNERSSLYLDHAATSFPKAPGVVAAVTAWYERSGVSPGRGDSLEGLAIADRVAACRAALARRLGLPAARVLFTSGGTESINLALHALLPRPGLRVLTTDLEHNAIARTLRALGAQIERVPCSASGHLDHDRALALLGEATRTGRPFAAFAFTHASNVTGAVVDARALCAAARTAGVPTLLDACQTAGARDLAALDADFVAFSAHKSLLGPPGLGVLGVAARAELPLLRFGGTGSSTKLDEQPDDWPTGREPGTPNTPAILGLAAALAWLDGAEAAPAYARQLATATALRDVLERAGLQVVDPGAHDDAEPLPVLAALVAPDDPRDPAELGMLLAEAGITVRTGFCCAPWIHDRLGGPAAESGVLRVSPGPFVDPRVVVPRLAAALGVD
jgi:cysteine desulfurase/selenocysteine lyase